MTHASHPHHNFISNHGKESLTNERKHHLHENITHQNLKHSKVKDQKISEDLKELGLILVDVHDGHPIFMGPLNAKSIKTISAQYVKQNSGESNTFNLDGNGITIGVWDGGGIRSTHREFLNDSGQTRISFGSDNGGNANDSHATHVAGTIASRGTTATSLGIASKVLLKSFDFSSDSTEMAAEASSLLLSNHSYGITAGWGPNNCFYGKIDVYEDITFGKYTYQAYTYDNISYTNTTYTIVFAAGNDRGDNGSATHKHMIYNNGWSCSGAYTCSHPKDGGEDGFDIITGANGAKNVITVAAIGELANGWQPGNTGTPASFTSFGPMDDGRIKPDISAKGVQVYSTESSGDSAYGYKSGTSMATPAVTGGLALLMEYQEKLHAATKLLSSTYKAIIIHTADEAGTNPGPDYKFGWGVMNVNKSVELMKKNKSINPSTIQEIAYSGSEQTIQINNADPQVPLVVTAVWTDPPSSIYNQTPYKDTVDATDKTLVNDIDIKIEQGASSFYPWKLSVSNPGNAATKIGKNNTDNVEQIRIDSPSGNYTLKLNHTGSLYQSKNQMVSLIIDYAKKPSITIPGNLNTASATYTFSGLAQSNATVNIFINDAYNSFTKSSGNGSWSRTVTFPNTGSLKVQAKVTENSNTRDQNTLKNVITTSNIVDMNYSGIVITDPASNASVYSPTVNVVGKTTASTQVKIYENLNLKETLTSEADGSFEKVLTINRDGKATINATITSGSETITSNTIILNFDVYKPRIHAPNAGTITIPTFNIIGTTEPNKQVNILKKPTTGPYSFVASGNSNAQGTFNIMIQPSPTANPSEYNQSFTFIASANVNVAGVQTNKTSASKLMSFNIQDYPTTITAPTSGSVIYSPTFKLIGKAKTNNQVAGVGEVNVGGSNVFQYKNSGTATIGTQTNGLKQFEITINAPKTSTIQEFRYKVTTNIYELTRESNIISLKFDVYKPSIVLPSNGTTISSPTFNIIGKTEPNINVEIIKNNKVVSRVSADATGSYNATVRYDFDGTSQTFLASANVTTDSGKAQKVSTSNTYTFSVPDIRPIIQIPKDNDTIFSKKVTIRGKTGASTTVRLYRDSNQTPIKTTRSDHSGYFSFSIDNPNTGNGPTINATYKVKANVYAKDYLSPLLNLKFKLDTNAPEIIYPTDGKRVRSNRIHFLGTAQGQQKIFIFERADGSQNEFLIGSTVANRDKKWTFETPVKANKTYFYSAKIEKIKGQPSSSIRSNEIKVISQLNSDEPYIKTPKNLSEIKTALMKLSGTSTKNSQIQIYRHNNISSITDQLIGTLTSSANGTWSKVFKSPPNNSYYFTAIVSTTNYRATSNTVQVKLNYNFKDLPLTIESHKDKDQTHKKNLTISGKSPNGSLHIYIDDELKQIITVTNNRWQTDMNFIEEKSFKIQAKITHNALEKVSSVVNISRNTRPKITKTSTNKVSNNKFTLTGTGKEKAILTITMIENSLSMMSQNLETMAAAKKEIVIGQITTDKDGYWSLDIPISSSGQYSFKIYENYGNASQIVSESYEYNLNLDNSSIALNIGPNPLNPTESTLKIQYILTENSDVTIGIYSITGMKLYGKSIPSGTSGALKGRNILVWDGKTNGVYTSPGLYIVILQIAGNEKVIKTKRLGIKW